MVVQSPSPLFCQGVDNALRVPASSCRGGFDFSLLFEEIILGIVPLGIVLIIVPFRLWHLFRKPRKVEVSWLLWAKVVCTSFLCALSEQGQQANHPTTSRKTDHMDCSHLCAGCVGGSLVPPLYHPNSCFHCDEFRNDGGSLPPRFSLLRRT